MQFNLLNVCRSSFGINSLARGREDILLPPFSFKLFSFKVENEEDRVGIERPFNTFFFLGLNNGSNFTPEGTAERREESSMGSFKKRVRRRRRKTVYPVGVK